MALTRTGAWIGLVAGLAAVAFFVVLVFGLSGSAPEFDSVGLQPGAVAPESPTPAVPPVPAEPPPPPPVPSEPPAAEPPMPDGAGPADEVLPSPPVDEAGEGPRMEERGEGGGSLPDVSVEPEYAPVTRFPYLDAPRTVRPGGTLTVTVALTLDQMTPGLTVKAGPGAKLNAEGALEMALPEDEPAWTVDVDLVAPGFDAADGEPLGRQLRLYRDDDSDFLHFALRARPEEKPGSERRLAARFYHAGTFLGSAAVPVLVVGDDQPAAARSTADRSAADGQPGSTAGAMAAGRSIAVDTGGRPADLDLLVLYDQPDNPGHARIFIHSPHLTGPVIGEFTLPDGAAAWIDDNIAQLASLGARLRGARALTGTPSAEASRDRIVAFAEGFGDELYRRYTSEAFRTVFERLQADGKLRSILVSSNSPLLPWELVRADGEFLGVAYRLGRWTPRDAGDPSDAPGGTIVFDGVAAIAPRYTGGQALPAQERELAALGRLDGFTARGGTVADFLALLREPPRHMIHFSGHGAVGAPGDGDLPFSILLEDDAVDPLTWRRLAGAAASAGGSLYFFNACDTGGGAVRGGFVRGWGTTVLESGAGGFIGGLWPLADRPAAEFAADYYGRLAAGLEEGPVALADVLGAVRRGFFDSGDPTYLAYAYYGDPNLLIVRDGAVP